MEATIPLERQRARVLAEEYRHRGYEVIEEPAQEQLVKKVNDGKAYGEFNDILQHCVCFRVMDAISYFLFQSCL